MLQIHEDVVEKAISALMRFSLGNAGDGVAIAAAHLLSERRPAREEKALEQLQEPPVIEELSDNEEGDACALVGLPQAAPQEEPAVIPVAPIPLGYRAHAREQSAPTREASEQTGAHDLPQDPSWEEVEGPSPAGQVFGRPVPRRSRRGVRGARSLSCLPPGTQPNRRQMMDSRRHETRSDGASRRLVGGAPRTHSS